MVGSTFCVKTGDKIDEIMIDLGLFLALFADLIDKKKLRISLTKKN